MLQKVYCVIFVGLILYLIHKEIEVEMAKKQHRKRKRTFSEKVILVLGVVIALSMLLSLLVNFVPQAAR